MIFYNFISLIPLFIVIYAIFKKKYKLLFYLILITITQLSLKHLTRNFFLRPEGACDCNYINKGGDAESEPGFPSGHVAITSFFINYIYFKNIDDTNNIDLFFINLIPIFVGLSRYKKKCHNAFQIFFGYLLSIIFLIIAD